MNLSNWYPSHKICLHDLTVQNNLVIQRTVEHKTLLMLFFIIIFYLSHVINTVSNLLTTSFVLGSS